MFLNIRHLLGTAYHKFSLFYSTLRMDRVRHEEIADHIMNNEVFENVTNSMVAFGEYVWPLRPGRTKLTTIPFYSDSEITIVHAEVGVNACDVFGHLGGGQIVFMVT